MKTIYRKGENFKSFAELCDHAKSCENPFYYYDNKKYEMKSDMSEVSFFFYFDNYDKYAPAIEVKKAEYAEVKCFREWLGLGHVYFSFGKKNKDDREQDYTIKDGKLFIRGIK